MDRNPHHDRSRAKASGRVGDPTAYRARNLDSLDFGHHPTDTNVHLFDTFFILDPSRGHGYLADNFLPLPSLHLHGRLVSDSLDDLLANGDRHLTHFLGPLHAHHLDGHLASHDFIDVAGDGDRLLTRLDSPHHRRLGNLLGDHVGHVHPLDLHGPGALHGHPMQAAAAVDNGASQRIDIILRGQAA